MSTLNASRAAIHKQTGCKKLESQSAIFSEFYATLIQSCITLNDNCMISVDSAATQPALNRKVSFKISTRWKLLTAEKFVGCELKIESNVCRLRLTNGNTESEAQPKLRNKEMPCPLKWSSIWFGISTHSFNSWSCIPNDFDSYRWHSSLHRCWASYLSELSWQHLREEFTVTELRISVMELTHFLREYHIYIAWMSEPSITRERSTVKMESLAAEIFNISLKWA